MTEQAIVIGKAALTEFATATFMAAGVARVHAEEWAVILVWANLRGVDSHGVLRIPNYLDRDRGAGQAPAAAVARHVDRDRAARQGAQCAGPQCAGAGRLGPRRGGTRHHRSAQDLDAASARRAKRLRAVADDRVPDQPR